MSHEQNSVFEGILTDKKLCELIREDEALDHLTSKRDSCGPDGIALSQLPEYWKINGSKIKKAIIEGSYRPGVVQNIELINRKGKKRIISVMNSIDRLILRATVQVVQPLCDELLEDNKLVALLQRYATIKVDEDGRIEHVDHQWMHLMR